MACCTGEAKSGQKLSSRWVRNRGQENVGGQCRLQPKDWQFKIVLWMLGWSGRRAASTSQSPGWDNSASQTVRGPGKWISTSAKPKPERGRLRAGWPNRNSRGLWGLSWNRGRERLQQLDTRCDRAEGAGYGHGCWVNCKVKRCCSEVGASLSFYQVESKATRVRSAAMGVVRSKIKCWR